MLRIGSHYVRRTFTRSVITKNLEKPKVPETISTTTTQQPTTTNQTTVEAPKGDVVPTEYEKKILVLSGKFKSKSDIPPRVGITLLQNAQSRLRIKVANILMVVIIISCISVVYLGKTKMSRAESKLQIEREEAERLRQEERQARMNLEK